jgi:hypothetical protein
MSNVRPAGWKIFTSLGVTAVAVVAFIANFTQILGWLGLGPTAQPNAQANVSSNQSGGINGNVTNNGGTVNVGPPQRTVDDQLGRRLMTIPRGAEITLMSDGTSEEAGRFANRIADYLQRGGYSIHATGNAYGGVPPGVAILPGSDESKVTIRVGLAP